jgi:succinoglycan biosynthesis transport protein ExoP
MGTGVFNMDRRVSARREINDANHEMTLFDILPILYRRIWLLVILVSVPTRSVLFFLKQQPHFYEAIASVILEAQEVKLTNFNDILSDMKFDNLTVPTQVEVLSSPSLAKQTIQKLRLRDDGTGHLILPIPSDGQNIDQVDHANNFGVLKLFLSNLGVKQQGTSRIIEISFKSQEPNAAALIVNTHTDVYLESKKSEKKAIAQKLDIWLSDEIEKLKQQSLLKSRAVQKFRAENGMVQGENSQELIYQQVSDVASQLAELEGRVMNLQARNHTLSESNSQQTSDIVTSDLIQTLKSQESLLAQKLQSLQVNFGPKHPDVLAIQRELSQIRGDISHEITNVRKSLTNELITAKKQKEALEGTLSELKTRLSSFQEKMITLRALQMEEQSSSKLLDNFLSRSDEIKSQIDFSRPDISIVSLADIPGEPLGSKKILIVIAVAAFSGFFTIALIFLMEYGYQTIKSAEDIYKLSGFGLLGTLPRARLPISDVLKKERSHFVEEIKRIFIHLNAQENGKTILFTSARRGEGKTTVAASVAYYMNNIGVKTLLIDADTIAPVIAGVTMVREHPGFFELMAGKKSLKDVIVRDKHGLSVIPCGEPNPYISDLLLAGKLEKPLEALKEQFDCIIFDCCPVLGISDVQALVSIADQVVLVSEYSKCPKDEFKKAADILKQIALRPPKVIINKIPVTALR